MVSTGESIRAALASFAADAPDNLYPRTINTWDELVHIVNTNGGTLKPKAAEMHVKHMVYTAVGDTYALLLEMDLTESPYTAVLLTPEGITRLPGEMGLDQRARDNVGRTGLMQAARLGDAKAVEALLRLGVHVWAEENAAHISPTTVAPGQEGAEGLASATPRGVTQE